MSSAVRLVLLLIIFCFLFHQQIPKSHGPEAAKTADHYKLVELGLQTSGSSRSVLDQGISKLSRDLLQKKPLCLCGLFMKIEL